MTISAVDESWSEAFSPWTGEPALRASTPVLRRADRLRRSIVPSLLGARRTNEALANPVVELFEVAKVYLPEPVGLPREELMLALTSGRGFLEVKGVLAALVGTLRRGAKLRVRPAAAELFEPGQGVELWLDESGAGPEQLLGFLGEVSAAGLKRFELRGRTKVAELRLATLVTSADLVPKQQQLSAYPAIARDLNLEVDLAVSWAEIEQTVRATAPYLESLEFKEDYRDPKQVPKGRKRLLFSFTLRSQNETLTNDEADAIRDRIVAACQERYGAKLAN